MNQDDAETLPAPGPVAEMAVVATKHDGPVIWFRRSDGTLFAVNDGTPEHRNLVRGEAVRIERPAGQPEPASVPKRVGPSRSTVESRSAAHR